MRLTTKGRFAVTAMIDLALRCADGPVTLAGIADRQKISLSYLEQLFGKLRRHELVVQQCDECGTLRFVPSERCRNCGSPSATWSPMSGDAIVYTFSIVHRAPTPAYQADAPYAIAYVELAEGPRMPTRLRHMPARAPRPSTR